MKISCCVFDLDGTLLTSKCHISDVDKATLREISKNGIKVVIATGRSIHQIKEYIRELGINDYIITYNGAYIANPATGEVIRKKVFKRSEIDAIEELFIREDLNYFFYTSKKVYYKKHCPYSEFQFAYNKTLPDDLKIPIYPISEMSDEERDDILVIALSNDTAIIPSLREKTKHIGNFTFLDSGDFIIDVISGNTSKGDAIKTLAEHFNIPLSEIVAFGDSQNDETMFKAVGYSVAMGNAYDSLKSIADFVTKSNDEYGITYAINHIMNEI